MVKKSVNETYRVAHFGDLHLVAEDEEFDWVLHMVDHALERGADHCVFTGDIVDEGQVEVIEALVRALRKRGLGSDEVSIVPGNHDVYPVAWPDSEEGEEDDGDDGFLDRLLKGGKSLRRKIPIAAPGALQTALGAGKANFKQLSRLIGAFNGAEAKLFSDIVFPYGKRLHPNVALAGFDTTRSVSSKPHDWATGELPGDHLDEVKVFFDENDAATHRIVLMHHYPFDDFEPASQWIPRHFAKPEADTVRNWLAHAGATLVLCGHIHEDRKRLERAPEGFDVMTTNSTYYGYVGGGSGRTYTLVTLGKTPRPTVEQIRVDEE